MFYEDYYVQDSDGYDSETEFGTDTESGDETDNSIYDTQCSWYLDQPSPTDGGRRCRKLLKEAESFYFEKKYHATIMLLGEAIKCRDDNEYTMLQVYRMLATCYSKVGNFTQAVHTHKHEMFQARLLDDKYEEATAYSNFASTLVKRDYFRNAVRYTMKELIIYKEMNDKFGMAKAYFSLGNIYRLEAKKVVGLAITSDDPEIFTEEIKNTVLNSFICYDINMEIIAELRAEYALAQTDNEGNVNPEGLDSGTTTEESDDEAEAFVFGDDDDEAAANASAPYTLYTLEDGSQALILNIIDDNINYD